MSERPAHEQMASSAQAVSPGLEFRWASWEVCPVTEVDLAHAVVRLEVG
jgi:hypothetical protein